MGNRWIPLVFGASLIALTGCAEPPQQEIDQVQKSLDSARQEKAAEYAPEALQAAADAQKQLEVELQAQAERWSVRRSYDRARELAQEADQKAATAEREAKTGRERARQQASDDLAALRAACEETRALLDGAPRGKGTQADLAALRGDLDGVEQTFAEAEASIAAESYKQASAQVQAARTIVDAIRSDVQGAIDLAQQKK